MVSAAASGFWLYWTLFATKLLAALEAVGLAYKLRSGQVIMNDKVLAVPIIYILTLFMHVVLPCFNVTGYAVDQSTKKPLVYRLNGILVLIAVLQIYLLFVMKNTTGTIFYNQYETCALTALAIGLFFSFVAYFYGGEEKYAR